MDRKNKLLIKQTKKFVEKLLERDTSGHDWQHIERVRKNALFIGKKEKADLFLVEFGALLHDVCDWKLQNGNGGITINELKQWLKKQEIGAELISKIVKIVQAVSFKGAMVKSKPLTLEGKVVQDADRLDALGAIGIARAFTYGGSKGKHIFNKKIKPKLHKSFSEYKKSNGTTINHFYEKLLLLRDRMNTKTGKKLAKERHSFMQKFLKQFFREIGPSKKLEITAYKERENEMH